VPFAVKIRTKLVIVLIFVSVINLLTAFSQETSLSESIISIAEELAADDSDPEMVGLYLEMLYDLYDNPVDINSNDHEELTRLFFLNDFQVKVIEDYITENGKVLSVFEIANLPGFDRETAKLLQPFIRLNEDQKSHDVHSYWKNNLVTNVSFKKQDNDSLWPGSPVKILTKYKFSASGLSGGITAEKDPGERMLTGEPPMSDLMSGYLAYNGKGPVRRFVIGDYSARFGQGTNINSGIRNYISLNSPGYMSARAEIRPYSSSDENIFFRGAGAEFSVKNFTLMTFWSVNRIDATTVTDTDGTESVTSLYTAGIHNTTSSLKKKDVLTDQVFGADLSFNLKNFRSGISWSDEKFSIPFEPEADNPEKLYSFSGDHNSITSLYYNALAGKLLLFGEMSVNNALKYAVVQGFTLRPADRLSINILFRDYERGYISFHGKGPGRSGYPHKAVTGNFTFEAAKHLFLSAGCEIIDYPWLRYNISSPSYAKRMEFRAKYSPSDKIYAEGAYTCSVSTTDAEEPGSIPALEEKITRNFNTSLRISVSEKLSVATRIYYKISENTGNTGTMLLEDIKYTPDAIPVTLWLRFSIFSTEDWDTRIYVYENDLLYSYSVPAVYGRGSKDYIMLGWKIREKAELRFRYSIQSVRNEFAVQENREEFRIQLKVTI
jgi:hypothetical protein